jgi:hypothetical protein
MRRFVPRFDSRWLVGLLIVGVVVAGVTMVRWGVAPAELELMVLGQDGQFHAVLEMPADWGETATVTTDAVARFPLILGVRNTGIGPARPGRLQLAVPLRYRLTGPGGEELDGRVDPATPLITYTLDPRLESIEPGLLPAMLPAYETLWIEALVPRYYCVEMGGGIPEFLPAPPPPLTAMSDVRIFYVLEGGDMPERQTGTLSLRLDTTLMAVTMPAQPPAFPIETGAELARPALGPLQLVGSRQVLCGEPEAPMELLSTVWESEGGARLITLDYGGTVRKHLFDLNGDGVIDRESWDPEGDGRFTATRRVRMPTPEFLLPLPTAVAYDMARFDGIPADSLARLDPMGRAMPGPGPLPVGVDAPEPRVAPPVAATPGAPPAPPGAPGAPGAPPAAAPPVEPAEPAPTPPPARRPAQPLGRPVQPPDGDERARERLEMGGPESGVPEAGA